MVGILNMTERKRAVLVDSVALRAERTKAMFFRRIDNRHFKLPKVPMSGTRYRWMVIVDGVKGRDLSFKSLRSARNYKHALEISHQSLRAKIIKREFMGEFIVQESEVS